MFIASGEAHIRAQPGQPIAVPQNGFCFEEKPASFHGIGDTSLEGRANGNVGRVYLSGEVEKVAVILRPFADKHEGFHLHVQGLRRANVVTIPAVLHAIPHQR